MKETHGTLYQFSATLIDGVAISLDSFQGKVLLIVNTASKCGFTPQYAGLEELQRRYESRGFAILGFPCNQFGRQEPGSAEEIGAFCQRNYGVTFPMFSKIDVNGPSEHPLYSFLKKSRRGIFGTTRIKWNFTKFLIDRHGRAVKLFAPAAKPDSLAREIEPLLDQPLVTPLGAPRQAARGTW